MTRLRIEIVALAGLGALLSVVACTSTTDASAPTESVPTAESMDWLEPSPDLAGRMDQRMEQVPWVHGLEDQVEMIQWWADKEELAYSRLLEMAADPRPIVQDVALAALASSRDGRLVEPLRTVPWPSEDQVDLRYSRARAHLALGDWSKVNILVDGLEDDRPVTRAMCLRTLRDFTQQDFGFAPQGPKPERAEAVQRWRQWYAQRSGDPLLQR